jgi:hypothetical protein
MKQSKHEEFSCSAGSSWPNKIKSERRIQNSNSHQTEQNTWYFEFECSVVIGCFVSWGDCNSDDVNRVGNLLNRFRLRIQLLKKSGRHHFQISI